MTRFVPSQKLISRSVPGPPIGRQPTATTRKSVVGTNLQPGERPKYAIGPIPEPKLRASNVSWALVCWQRVHNKMKLRNVLRVNDNNAVGFFADGRVFIAIV